MNEKNRWTVRLTEKKRKKVFYTYPDGFASKSEAEIIKSRWTDDKYILAEVVEMKQIAENLPCPPLPEGFSEEEYFIALLDKGCKEHYPQISETVHERLEYEKKIILKAGLTKYFLIVAEYVAWSKAQGILIRARGSCNSSLVNYLLGITEVDPLEYNIPLEAFYNFDRKPFPDIDIDVEYGKRSLVIEHMQDLYGKDFCDPKKQDRKTAPTFYIIEMEVLSLISKTLKLIYKKNGCNFSVQDIALDDKKTLEVPAFIENKNYPEQCKYFTSPEWSMRKGHAVSFTKISFLTAYLKVHHPDEFNSIYDQQQEAHEKRAAEETGDY